MAAGGVDGHRLVDGAGAALHLAGARLAAAQQVEHVGGARPLGAEPLHHVHHRGVAVAQRSVRVLRPAGQLDRRRQEHRVQLLHVAVAGRQPQLGGRGVRLGAGEQVVVDLHDDPAALGQPDAVARLADRLLAARRPGPDPRRVVDVLEVVETGAAEAGPALAVLLGVLLLRRRDLLGGDLEQDHVVDDLGVAGQHRRAGEPGVALELGVEQEAAVVVGARAVRRGGGVRRRHRRGSRGARPCAAAPPRPARRSDRRGPSWPDSADSSADVSVAAASVASWPAGCSRRCCEQPGEDEDDGGPAAAARRALIRAATGGNARRGRAGGRGRRSARRRRRC